MLPQRHASLFRPASPSRSLQQSYNMGCVQTHGAAEALGGRLRRRCSQPMLALLIVRLSLSLCSKTRGMGAGRKLRNLRREERWADKDYNKSHLGRCARRDAIKLHACAWQPSALRLPATLG